jgi:integrase
LGRFCTVPQITPREVDDTVLHDFLDYLDANRLSKTPARIVGDTIRAWNRYVATDPGGPFTRLTLENRSNKYTLVWDELPPALYADVQAYHETSLHPDPLDADARRAVRPSTIYARDRQIRRIASAAILNGVPADKIHCLADLVRLDVLKPALQFFLDRNDKQPNKQFADLVGLMLTIALHWVKAPADDINQIRLWERRFRRKQNGLTEKNKDRLRQFSDREVLRTLVRLPEKIVDGVKGRPVDSRTALRMQTAVAISLLLIAPIRIGNLVRLDRQKHFKWARFDGERVLHLVIPAEEVKNSVDLEFPIPEVIAELLGTYLETYQPLLANGHPSSALFPGRDGGSKHDTAPRRQITTTIRKELGLDMNPHLLRHLAALLFLEKHPGHYEEVRRLLFHRNINTTIQNYAGLETAGAARRYDQIILGLRNGAPDGPQTRP